MLTPIAFCKLSCRFALIAVVCSLLVSARPREKEKESNSEVKFTSHTELVLIPTLVTDKSGNHIKGLKQEEFTVLENGAEQKIATFEEITSDAQRASRPRNPGEFSNTVTGGTPNRRLTIIVLDLLNTRFTDQAYARKDLLKYLSESVNQREPTALYTLTRTGIHVVHDYATDPRVLVAALHKVRGDASEMVDSPETVEGITGTAGPDGSAGIDAESVRSEASEIQSMMEDSELNFQSFMQRLAITYTLEGMQQVAQAVSGFPGRKSLIWASGGFPFSVSDNSMSLAPAGRDSLSDVMPLYERTWQLLNNAQISLYPVDVKGLQSFDAPSSVGNPGENYGRNMRWRNLDTLSSFQTFAAMTGGRAYYNSNDLAKGFREAVSDSSEYYMLGYYLDRTRTKAGWRKLAVKVKRDHIEVRARSGFFVTNVTVDPGNSRNNDISSALQSPLNYTSLSMVVRWDKIDPAQATGKKHVNFVVHLAPDTTFIDAADNNHLALDVVVLARTPEGKSADPPVTTKIDTHLPADKASAMSRDGIGYQSAIDLAPGEYTVRFVVRNALSGRTGSVAAPLKVE
ncbi:MAG TPA: VWA domain-containing protein [Terriglobales bacterium]|nr:VWA domain-containing protein [Terriglobales bacterium]